MLKCLIRIFFCLIAIQQAGLILQKGGDKKCVNQKEAKARLGIVGVTVGVDVVHFSDVSYPQKKNRKGWKTTETN